MQHGLNDRLEQRVRAGPTDTSWVDRNIGLSGRVGITLAVDAAGFAPHGDLEPIDDTIELRRFFVYTTGEFRIGVPILFKIDFGIVGEDFYFSDVYVWFTDVPYVGTVRVGQFDAPMSLEATTGSTDETFMEYGSPVQAFVPGLKVGVEISDHAESRRGTWAFGYFTNGQNNDVGDASQSVARLVGRATWLAIVPNDPRDLLMHLGGSASYVLSSREEIRYRSRPESFLAPVLVDTGDLDTRSAFPLGLEFAAARGPLTLQAEYLAAVVDADDLGDPIFGAMYASASWFLTGERRPYDFTTGEFGRLVPRRAVSWRHGRWGAWEIAARLSYLDLSDAEVVGGRMLIGTAGLNWYVNRYLRLMVNTNLAQLRDRIEDGTLAVVQIRTQLVF